MCLLLLLLYISENIKIFVLTPHSGATSIVKIGEVWLSDEIGGVVETLKKPNFIITIRYEIPTFSSVGPFFKEGGGGRENFGQKLKFFGFFQLRSPLRENH